MVIDISAYNGKVDWKTVSMQDVDGVILRATTRNGQLDNRFIENYNGILQNMNNKLNSISIYKFAYTREYIAAYNEAVKTLQTLKDRGVRLEVIDCFYCDLERWDDKEYTREECNAVLKGYRDACDDYNVKFGMYFNYNYAKNIVDGTYWKIYPLWIARYNSTLGDGSPFKPTLWQYTSAGTVKGINGKVDISRRL